MRLQRYGRDEDRSWHKALQQTTIPLTAQIAHFCDVIRGVADLSVSVHDGLQNLRLVAASQKAARTAAVVRLSKPA